MARRASDTDRLRDEQPGGRGLGAVIDSGQENKNTRRTEDQSSGSKPDKLVKATFLLDPESVDILDRVWLRQRKREGHSKSALVRQAIRRLKDERD